MTLEQIDKIITDPRQQIPPLQMQLHQSEGYKQALVDMDTPKEEEKTPVPKKLKSPLPS